MNDIIILLAVGLAAGFLSGLVGIGGGIIIVPVLVYFLGFTQQQAQGTTLFMFLFPIGILGIGQVFDDIEIPSKKEIKKLLIFGLFGFLYITIVSYFIFKSLLLTIVVVILSFLFIFLLNLYCYLKSSSRIKSIFKINF